MKFRDNKSISAAKFAEWDNYYRNLVDTARSKTKANNSKTKTKRNKEIKDKNEKDINIDKYENKIKFKTKHQ